MAVEEEEGEVAVEVEAEEEADTVAKGVGTTPIPVMAHPSTEFVPLSKCSSVWLFSVIVLLFPTRVGVGACVHTHVSLYCGTTKCGSQSTKKSTLGCSY